MQWKSDTDRDKNQNYMRLFIINVTPFWKISDPLHPPHPLPPGFTPLCTIHCALTKFIHKKPSPSLAYRNLWMVPSCWTSLLKDIGLQSSLLLHVCCQFLLLSLLFKSISTIVHVLLQGTQGKVVSNQNCKMPNPYYFSSTIVIQLKTFHATHEIYWYLFTVIRNFHRQLC